MSDDLQNGLDELEAQLDEYEQRLDDHEATLDRVRDRLDTGGEHEAVSPSGVPAGGLLAALGLTAGVGTASAAPTGRIGTDASPVDTVSVATLDGPLTDGQRVESLVGQGLTIKNGALSLKGGN